MAELMNLTVRLAVSQPPTAQDARVIEKSIKAALTHWNGEQGLSDEESELVVEEVYEVVHNGS